MRFIVDECTGPSVAAWLRDQNHDVFSVFEDSRGMNDDNIIKKAYEEKLVCFSVSYWNSSAMRGKAFTLTFSATTCHAVLQEAEAHPFFTSKIFHL